MRGRPPKPTTTLKLTGAYKPGRHGDRLEVELGTPECPSWLQESARPYWEMLIRDLQPCGVLAPVDAQQVALLADALRRYVEANEIIAEHGSMVVEKSSGSQPHPALGPMHAAWEQFFRLAAQFGMTPAARARIRTQAKEAPKDGKARYFGSA